MRCAICRRDIQAQTEVWVSTSDELVVHVTCADYEAIHAWSRRQRQALFDVAILVALLGDVILLCGNTIVTCATGVLGVAVHIAVHPHWWISTALTIRRYCRRMSRQV
jgi:hypothetical protein